MPSGELVVGLDLGSETVRALALESLASGKKAFLACGSAPSAGLRRGVVTDLDAAAAAIATAVADLEQRARLSVGKVVLGITGEHLTSLTTRGIGAVAGGGLEVRRADVRRVVEQAQQLVLPPEREILQVLVRQFFLDGQGGIKNPLGLSGLRLEVETHIVTALSSHVRNAVRAVELAGVSVVEPVLTALASASATLTSQERELGVLLIDIGGAVTDWALFESGEVLASGVVPFGGERVTLDLAVGLGIHRDTAERVKLGRSPEERDPAVEEIVMARMAELFEWVGEARTVAGGSQIVPGGVVLTGGGAQLLGAAELAQEYFCSPASVRGPGPAEGKGAKGSLDVTLSAAWGLALWGGRSEPRRGAAEALSEWLAAGRRRLGKKR